MQTATSDMPTSFTGVLIRRQYKPGQSYVQLVFKGAKDTKLSISRNIRMIKSLRIGTTYRVVGPEYVVGSKTFIREPKAIPLPSESKKSRKMWFLVIAIIFAAGIFIIGGFLAVKKLTHNNTVQAAPAAQQGQTQSSNTQEAQNPAAASPTTTTATTPTTKPKTQSTNTSSTVGSNTPPATSPAADPVPFPVDPNAPVDPPVAPPQDPLPTVPDPNNPPPPDPNAPPTP